MFSCLSSHSIFYYGLNPFCFFKYTRIIRIRWWKVFWTGRSLFISFSFLNILFFIKLFKIKKNHYGQLCLPLEVKFTSELTLVFKDDSIKQIVCGTGFTLLLKFDGSLMRYGNLGFNYDPTRITFPVLVTKDEQIKEVFGGYSFAMFLKHNGELWGLGSNSLVSYFFLFVLRKLNLSNSKRNGQLGIKNPNSQSQPVKVMTDQNIKQVSCGGYHTLILMKDGSLLGAGRNESVKTFFSWFFQLEIIFFNKKKLWPNWNWERAQPRQFPVGDERRENN